MENDLEPLRFLTLREAAKVLQLSTRTLRRMVDHKESPAMIRMRPTVVS
jgi:predicted DNA-binding transcriptional regulator AlpA